ncbi:MAG: hypothetical protein K1X83_03335 [Oligoflexia bacterium]|nr:hypothetical protein [Oligoflexia bacterium]
MNSSASKGNDPARWEKLLAFLDEKLQFGLLDHLSRITSYHFEADVLYIEPGSPQDGVYLAKASTFQQLQLMAHEALRIDSVKLKSTTP